MILLQLPPPTDEALIISIVLAALGGGVVGCILTLIRRTHAYRK